MKQKINMVGGGFQHDICSSHGGTPKIVEWVKERHTAPISIHIDHAIFNTPINKDKRNFAWFAESSAIINGVVSKIKDNINFLEENYELLFTHDERILPLSSKFRLVLTNAIPWVKEVGVYKKNKLISMIASNKRMCQGHLYRQKIIVKYRNKVDHYGRGFKTLGKKEDGLKDYMFSIAMENDNYNNIFTEKITDCFAMGTIPIFWGMPKIGELFNMDGIILLDELKIEELTPELYYSKMDAIKDNYERALKIPITEDDFFEKYIK